jgi:hypothetical protein
MRKAALQRYLGGKGIVPRSPRPGARGDEDWYRWQGHDSAVEHLVVTYYKSSLRGYAVSLGMSYPPVTARLNALLPRLVELIDPRQQRGLQDLPSFPCWQRFDAGRHLGWGFYIVRTQEGGDDWTAELDRLADGFLAPVFGAVGTPGELARFLLRDDEPFEWAYSGPVLRAAEVVLLGREDGWTDGEIEAALAPHLSPVLLRRLLDVLASEADPVAGDTAPRESDRQLLSAALLEVAEQAEDIRDELAAHGYDRPGAIVRAAQEALAEQVSSVRGLRDYWRELAKVEVTALEGPAGSYRSPLIDALRSKAPAHIPQAQVEPAIRSWAMSGALMDQVLEAAREARRETARASGIAQKPGFAEMGWRERNALLRERYALQFAEKGFKLVQRGSLLLAERRTGDGRFVFALADRSRDGSDGGVAGKVFAVTRPGARLTAREPEAASLALFYPSQLVPELQYSLGFEHDSYPEFCLAVDTIACLTAILFRRLDAALEKSSN